LPAAEPATPARAAASATQGVRLADMPTSPDAATLAHMPASGPAAPASAPAAPGTLLGVIPAAVATAMPETLWVLAACCATYLGPHVNSDEAVDTQQKIKNVVDCYAEPITKVKLAEIIVQHSLLVCSSA